jgi:hypothetical protein
MNAVSIAVENKSSVLTDEEVQAAIPAWQHQVSYDFKPYWNEGARLVWVPSGSSPPTGAGSWLLSILDDSDQAGALGYHDVTADNTPLMKVFARTDLDSGLSWTVTASHEILETLADPWISAAWQTSNTEFVALEVGDPVEADELGYLIEGVLVSDFILPAWYVSGLKVPKYDFAGHLSGPLQIAPGGYVSIFVSCQGWTQKQMRDGALVDVDRDPDDPRFRDRSITNALEPSEAVPLKVPA